MSSNPQHFVRWTWPKRPTEEHRNALRKLLGDEPVWPIKVPDHPVIFVGGRVHAPTFTHLANRAPKVASGSKDTAKKAARHLCTYVGFLGNVRGLWHEDQSRSDVMVADKDDWQAFAEHFLSGDNRVSDSQWNEMNGAIQAFYRWAERALDLAPPWDWIDETDPTGKVRKVNGFKAKEGGGV